MATSKNPERGSHARPQGIPAPSAIANPRWWSEEHTVGWDQVREAFRRDWEQTKSDLSFGKAGTDLHQSIPDTVKQATGKEPVPAAGVPNGESDFGVFEPAYRFGYGARRYFGKEFPTWDDRLESRLRTEWTALGGEYDARRTDIRRGWDYPAPL